MIGPLATLTNSSSSSTSSSVSPHTPRGGISRGRSFLRHHVLPSSHVKESENVNPQTGLNTLIATDLLLIINALAFQILSNTGFDSAPEEVTNISPSYGFSTNTYDAKNRRDYVCHLYKKCKNSEVQSFLDQYTLENEVKGVYLLTKVLQAFKKSNSLSKKNMTLINFVLSDLAVNVSDKARQNIELHINEYKDKKSTPSKKHVPS